MWNHFFLDHAYTCTNELAEIQANNELFEVGRWKEIQLLTDHLTQTDI